MTKRNLTFLAMAFFFFSATLFAQKKNSYSRMHGRLGGNINVVGNFQRNGSRMDGSYSYNLYINDSLTHLSHIVTLYGDIDKHNNVIFKQYPANDTTIAGLFTDSRFTGSWHGSDSTILPFDLSKTYTKGSIPLNVFYLHSGKELASGHQSSPSAEIELTLIYPKNSVLVSKAVSDSVKKFIRKQFFGQSKSGELPEDLLAKSEQNFYNQFNELNSHWKNNHKLGFNMEKKEQVLVIFNGYNLLCLQYKKRGYAGRGNPMEHISYDIIDLRNGKKLTPENIFKPDAKLSITKLINKKIRENNGLSEKESLKKIGFFYDSIPISRNMAFNGNGISFVYNVYDLAPPAMGIQKIFLPFSEIGTYIRSSSVLYPLSR